MPRKNTRTYSTRGRTYARKSGYRSGRSYGTRKYKRKYNHTKHQSYRKTYRRNYHHKSNHFATRSELSIVPPKKHLILRYVNTSDTPYLVLPSGAVGGYGWINYCINDIYHFLRGVNGTPYNTPTVVPMATEFKDWYVRWKVHMVEYSVTVTNVTTSSFYIGIICDAENFTINPPSPNFFPSYMGIMKTNKYCKLLMVPPNGARDAKITMKMRIPIGKMIGDIDTYRGDADFNGGSATSWNSSPLKVINMWVFILNSDGSTPGATFQVPVNIECNFFMTAFARDLEES